MVKTESVILFVYGTLTIPEVINELVGYPIHWEEAYIKDYDVRLLEGKIYPGLFYKKDSTTEGKILTNLTSDALKIIDLFEDKIYQLTKVTAVRNNTKPVSACTYMIAPSNQMSISCIKWDKKHFESTNKKNYVAMCKQFHDNSIGNNHISERLHNILNTTSLSTSNKYKI